MVINRFDNKKTQCLNLLAKILKLLLEMKWKFKNKIYKIAKKNHEYK